MGLETNGDYRWADTLMVTSAATYFEEAGSADCVEGVAAAQLDSVRVALEVTPEQDAFLAGAVAALRAVRNSK